MNNDIFYNSNIQSAPHKLVIKLQKDFKTLEDAKFIYSQIKGFNFFNKFIDNHFSNSMDEAVLYLCKNMIYEKYPPGALILNEGDKSNNKFYVILSGEVSILIRNSENVFISENLQKKFLSKLNKERHSMQPPPSDSIGVPSLIPMTAQIPKHSIDRESPIKSNLKETQQNIRKTSFKKLNTMNSMKSDITIRFPNKKKMSLIPGLLSSHNIRASKTNTDNNVEEDHFLEKETQNITILPFFHLGKELVLQKLKEMGYTNKELYKGEGFGEVALLDSKARRTATVLALTHIELIVILKKDFLLIRQKFSHEYKAKKKFLIEVLPFLKLISSSSTLDNIIFCFKEFRLNHKQRVIAETDANPDKVYFLMRGKCKIEKNFHFNLNGIPQIRSIHICDVDYKGIIGEEVLFLDSETGKYHYTATVASEEAFFFTVSKNSILSSFPKEIKAYLYETFLMKKGLRKNIFEKFSQKVLEANISPEIQSMIDLKIGVNEKIMKNMNLGLRVNYYQKLKNTVNEDFLSKGGIKEGNKWESDIIFESLKRSISEKIGLEKLFKAQKLNKEASIKTLIRKEDTSKEKSREEGNGNGDIREIVPSHLGDIVKNKTFDKKERDDKDVVMFDFGAEQQNHRLEVYRKAKIGKFQGPKFRIPHNRIVKNLWGKAQERKNKINETSENTVFTITSNDFLHDESKKLINCFMENAINKDFKESNERRIQSSNVKQGKSQKHLKIFLKKFDISEKPEEDIVIGETGRRLHSSQNSRNAHFQEKINDSNQQKYSFSRHLCDVQRTQKSLRKRKFIFQQNTTGFQSDLLIFDKDKN